MKKSKISQLAPSFRYLQTLALKNEGCSQIHVTSRARTFTTRDIHRFTRLKTKDCEKS